MSTIAADTKLDETALTALAGSFRGQLVRPSDPTYDEHRKIWNGSIDRSPALIARCAGVADVMAAVRFAMDNGVVAAIRSGGHSFPGHSVCNGGLVIDLGLMRGVRVDPEARTARAQAGILLGELDRETQAFGLAVPAGIVTHTGLAGLTLGGGIGWLMRKYGLTIDQLLAVDMVTAGPIFWRMEESPNVLRFYRDWIADVPDELTTIVVHRKAPPLPVIPPELHGVPVVAVTCCYAGPVEDGEKVVRPMREFGSPLLDLCEPKPFLTHQAMFDPSFPHGWWYYFRSCDLATLTDDIIDIVADRAARMTSPLTAFPIFHLGGAIKRVGEDETAFNGRVAGHTLNINATTATSEGFDEEREWSRSFWSALEPYHTSVYVNFLMDEGEDRIRQAYGARKYDRLQALKRTYDPDNLFKLNQNIPPG